MATYLCVYEYTSLCVTVNMRWVRFAVSLNVIVLHGYALMYKGSEVYSPPQAKLHTHNTSSYGLGDRIREPRHRHG